MTEKRTVTLPALALRWRIYKPGSRIPCLASPPPEHTSGRDCLCGYAAFSVSDTEHHTTPPKRTSRPDVASGGEEVMSMLRIGDFELLELLAEIRRMKREQRDKARRWSL